MIDKVVNGLNTVLVANTFFVLASFGWFVVALVGRSAGLPLGFDLWYKLWEPVFTPALGLLMGGAILSGVLSQIRKRFLQGSNPN